MRSFPPATAATAAAAAAGAVLAAALLAGCGTEATTNNGVTPGPPLPSGMTLPPGVTYHELATATATHQP